MLSASLCHSDIVSEGRLLLMAQEKLITGKKIKQHKDTNCRLFLQSKPDTPSGHTTYSLLLIVLNVKIPSVGKQNTAGNICLQVCGCVCDPHQQLVIFQFLIILIAILVGVESHLHLSDD